MWTAFTGKQGLVQGCCDHSNKTSGTIKYGEFLDWLRNYQFFITGL